MEIQSILAREILDSRAQPTVEVEILLENGVMAYASVPSGASTGSKEACELRDKDQKRYLGKGVLKATEHVRHEINDVLRGLSVLEQEHIDRRLIALDGTMKKEHMGANAILATSLAVCKAAALCQKKPLYEYIHSLMNQQIHPSMPVPLMNIINGGAHADNDLDIQEFMIVPFGAGHFTEAMRYGVEIYHALKAILKVRGLVTAVGDEGGFAPHLGSAENVLDVMMQAIAHTGLVPGKDVGIAMDVAASEFYRDQKYYLMNEQRCLNSEQMALYLQKLADAYPIISIEDGMDENDWEGWSFLTKLLGKKLQLVGDDLFVTNKELLQEGMNRQAANAILIKPNQIGTLTETIETIETARTGDFKAIISHRSGETEETFIADLAVASGVGQIKTGAPCRTDRVAKYNRLLRIAEKSHYPFSGASFHR